LYIHADKLDGKVNMKVIDPLIPQHVHFNQPRPRMKGIEKVKKGVNNVHESLCSLLAKGELESSFNCEGDHAKVDIGSSPLQNSTVVRIPSYSSQGANPSRKF
jgi:hypothetical protein